MEKYLIMATDNGSIDAMNILARYYSDLRKEHGYELMKKYYLIAIDKGKSSAMRRLGDYYKIIEKG